MKFTVSSTTLCNRLLTLSRVLASKNSLQILDCILFELEDDGKLRLTASDSETTLVSSIDINDADEKGKFAVKANTIVSSLKEISEQPITIEVNKKTFEIVITYQNGTSNFVGQSGDEYPIPQGIGDGVHQLNLDTQVLLNGITRALFAAAADDSLRPQMSGIYFDVTEENVTFVASDGAKLVRDRNFTVKGDQSSSFILPKKPAKMLKDILGREAGEVAIKYDDRNALFTLENFTLSCRLIEGRFPNYNSVIPQDNPFRITIDRAALLGALRRVMVFANVSTSLVKLRIDTNTLTVSAQDVSYATSAEEHVMCDYSGTPMRIGFKGTFLIDILNSIT
ncbi:MAG: DNA polymerase III subunit beta, partial [Salinivirgaceae bacterium]|nr:DNA polymerase III subunit beta [Salinivirgaceae bacterium]